MRDLSIEEKARWVVDKLASGDFAAITSWFDDAMARALRADSLATGWNQSMSLWGPFRNISQVKTGAQGAHQVAVALCGGEQSDFRVVVSFDSAGRIAGLFIKPPEQAVASKSDEDRLSRLQRNLLLMLPAYAAVPLLFFLLGSRVWEVRGRIGTALLGALGWMIALGLRAPVGLLAKKMAKSPQMLQTATVLSSGPLEELTRLALLVAIGATFQNAYMLGLGWAAIEVIYAVTAGFLTMKLASGQDERAALIRAKLQGSGTDAGPFLGVIERISASAIHIGFALLIAYNPWLVLAAIPAHSGTNMLAVKLMKRVVLTQAAVFAIGLVVFLIGLFLHGKL